MEALRGRGRAVPAAVRVLLTARPQLHQRDSPQRHAPCRGGLSILRVENYQELVNALIYLISLGEEEGTVRMYNYDQDVEQSLFQRLSGGGPGGPSGSLFSGLHPL